MTTVRATTPATRTAARRRVFGGLAVAWWVLTTFVAPDVPAVAAVVVLGLLVTGSVEPDARVPTRGVTASGRNLVLAALAATAFVAVLVGRGFLLGAMPIASARAVLATCAAAVVVLPRWAGTRDCGRPAVLGHRELILTVTALVAAARMYQNGEVWITALVFPPLAAAVMAVRRIRSGAASPRLLTRRSQALQAGNFWLFTALPGAAGLTGMFFIVDLYAPDAGGLLVAGFWAGLGAMAVLVAFPRRRLSVAADGLVALASVLLVVQLVGGTRAPRDAVTIGLPSDATWHVASGGRSALVNAHWTFDVERHAVDLVELVDGRSHRGDGTRLEDFAIFGQPVLAVADGRVTTALDTRPDLPVGASTRHAMEGNHLVLDIGGGRYVLYAHLEQGSLQVRAGDEVRRGQVIGRVGDSGNSGEPHLHIQVQNTPTFDVADPGIRTYPILFEGATVADVRRGDPLGPALH